MFGSFESKRNWNDICLTCYGIRRGDAYECEIVVKRGGVVVGRRMETLASPAEFDLWLDAERVAAIEWDAERIGSLKRESAQCA